MSLSLTLVHVPAVFFTRMIYIPNNSYSEKGGSESFKFNHSDPFLLYETRDKLITGMN